MVFKDLKQNYPVYILDKENFKFFQGKITNNPFSHLDLVNGTNQMMVDLNVETSDKTLPLTIPENSSITYTKNGNLVISVDREGLIQEVQVMINNAEQIISQQDKAKETLKKAKSLMLDMSPQYREKQETELRFNKIENSVDEIKNLLQKFISSHS